MAPVDRLRTAAPLGTPLPRSARFERPSRAWPRPRLKSRTQLTILYPMKVSQQVWEPSRGWRTVGADGGVRHAALVWVFADSALLLMERLHEVHHRFPGAVAVGCSTAGEVHGTTVSDQTVVATVLEFESSSIQVRYAAITSAEQSVEVGRELASSLPTDGLKHVVVLSDGLRVNGSALTRGVVGGLPVGVSVSGGLAADGARFQRTSVIGHDSIAPGVVSAIGFYGPDLQVGCASLGGWDPFGPERTVTRALGNVLFEMDGKSALELYKTYLGPKAAELPGSGLLFPLAIRVGTAAPVVRTILAVNEAEGSITFAGDVPVGSHARLMKANFDRLIDGTRGAAASSRAALHETPCDFALLISCVGRKLVLGQRTEEEVEGVREVVGDRAVLAGFYSYGEISPFTSGAACELHNQTMTITTFAERPHAPAA